MSQILYAWELGNALGHAGSFVLLAKELRERGHGIHWLLAETAPTEALLAQDGFKGAQAPFFPETPLERQPISYSDILLRFGYAHPPDLFRVVTGWREVIIDSGARIVLADHAPTAILAARTLGIPVMLFSSGFCVPPRHRPLPNMRPWQATERALLESLDRQALASINFVLAYFGRPALNALEQLFDVEEDTLIGFPELDHYAERGAARYWGNLPDAGVDTLPVWPEVPGKRVFAYLRPELPQFEPALEALGALDQPALVFIPGLTQALIKRHASRSLVCSGKPFDLVEAARQADVALTYGSVNTTTCFLLNGKPLLLVPRHLEQYLLARRVEEMGAGLIVNAEETAANLREKLQRLLVKKTFTSNAQSFAAKYAAFRQSKVIANLIRRIEEIAGAEEKQSG